MSNHVVPLTSLLSVMAECRRLLREPTSVTAGATNATLTFTLDLTAGQVTTLNQILAAARSMIPLATEERTGMEADLVTLRAYQSIGSPTLVQTANAMKAHVRILRTLLRD